MALALKTDRDVVELLASTVETATDTSSGMRLPGIVNAVVFTLDVTAVATDVGDTLDVAIQTKVDGANWVDACAFTQILGNGIAVRLTMKVLANTAEGIYVSGASLAANAVRHVIGDEWRVSWAIVDSGDADQSFTFSAAAMVM